MVKDCPYCGLVNPPHAERCDCGREFATGAMRGTLLNERDRANNATNAEAMRPTVPVPGCIGLIIGSLIIYGSNGWGRLLAGSALMLACFASSLFHLGIGGVFVGFGVLAIALDLGVRALVLRVRLVDNRAGSCFAFLPVWMWGVVATVIGNAIVLALHT